MINKLYQYVYYMNTEEIKLALRIAELNKVIADSSAELISLQSDLKVRLDKLEEAVDLVTEND